ncbi:hypothetical protein [Mycolicibacterium gilvum]|uniref:hypothetical protein n=1 Tax=Mycolicibacterium gilvum TaxID=1804 RepID=UPI0040453442
MTGPYRQRRPWPRRLPASLVGHRLPGASRPGHSGADAAWAAPGRRQLGNKVGQLTITPGAVLL